MVKYYLPFLILIGFTSIANSQTASFSPLQNTDQISDTIRFPLMVSNDFGKSWSNASGNLPSDLQVSFIEQIGIELIIASDNKGIYLSNNNRTSWKQISSGLPNLKINALHTTNDVIYTGVYKSGLFESYDNGETWHSLNKKLPNKSVQAILEYKNQLIVGTDIGIFILDRENKQWISTSLKAQTLSIYTKDNYMIAGTSLGTAISKDGGQNWDWIRQDGSVHYTHPAGNSIVELELNGDLVFSNDLGHTWEKITYQPREASYIYEIIKVDDSMIISNSYGIHLSDDEGKSWKLIYSTESMAFFDFLLVDNVLYGGTRAWDEYRKRN